MPNMDREGLYWGGYTDVETGCSDKGTPFMALKFLVTHFAVNNQFQPIEPIERRVWIYLTDKAWQSGTKEILQALGFNGNFQAPSFNPTVVAGVRLRCSHENYQGKVRPRWSFADLSPGQKQYAVIPQNTLMQLSARWRQEQVQSPGGGMGAPTLRPPAAAPVNRAASQAVAPIPPAGPSYDPQPDGSLLEDEPPPDEPASGDPIPY